MMTPPDTPAERHAEQERRLNDELNADVRYRYDGGNPMRLALQPLILSASEYERTCQAARTVERAVRKIVGRILEGPLQGGWFRNHSLFEGLIRAKRRHGRAMFLSRFDYVRSRDGEPKFIELNTSCPIGPIMLSRWRRLVATYQGAEAEVPGASIPLDDPLHFPRRILALAREHYDVGPNPRVGLAHDATCSAVELSLMADAFRSCGAPAEVCTLDRLSYDGRRLVGPDGGPLDVLYVRTAPTPSLHHGWDAAALRRYSAFLDASRDGAACILNPFPALTVAGDKGIFACLHQPDYRDVLTGEERDAIARHVPPTYFVAPDRPEVLEMLRSQRERFVLKPRTEDQGRFIAFGSDLDASGWGDQLAKALDGRWITQEVVESEPVIEACSGGAWTQDLTVFVIDGEPAGPFARIGPGRLTNLKHGGKIQAVFIEPRD